MKAALPKGSKEYIELSKLISLCYQDYEDGFYVNAPPNGMDEKDKDKVVSYIIRYTGRPAMAQSRISAYSYNKKEISYWYDDHKTDERISVTEHVYKFMLKLIRHIPNRHFKMTRYYASMHVLATSIRILFNYDSNIRLIIAVTDGYTTVVL